MSTLYDDDILLCLSSSGCDPPLGAVRRRSQRARYRELCREIEAWAIGVGASKLSGAHIRSSDQNLWSSRTQPLSDIGVAKSGFPPAYNYSMHQTPGKPPRTPSIRHRIDVNPVRSGRYSIVL